MSSTAFMDGPPAFAPRWPSRGRSASGRACDRRLCEGEALGASGAGMEAGVERLAALVLMLTCVSHIAAPRAWSRLFDAVRAQGEAAGLINAAIHLPLGLAIAAFHPVWTWPGAVVTLLG